MNMTRTKTKVITVLCISLAMLAVVAFKVETHKNNSWRSADIDSVALNKTPPQVAIVPTKFPERTSRRLFGGASGTNEKVAELGVPLSDIVAIAYGNSPQRTILPAEMPAGRFDFVCTLPREALQRQLQKQFGLTGHHESRLMDILALRVEFPDASGLKPNSHSSGRSLQSGKGRIVAINMSAENLAHFLEHQLNTPVIDETGLGNRGFDFNLKWDQPDDLRQAVLDQLGLDLVPTNMPVEVLIVEKIK